MIKSARASLAVVLSFCMGTEAFAIGSAFIANEVPSARSAGQGYVGIAGQNDDPTTVYTNPAAMTSLKGTAATFGLHWENIHGSYQDNAGNTTKERVVNAAVPNLSLTQSFLDGKLAAGLSVQSPFGLSTNWDGNSPLRYAATNSQVNMVDITPAIAYQFLPMVSVGVGADYMNINKAQLDRHVNVDAVNFALGSPTLGSADAISDLRGQSANWGYHAGIVIQPTPQHSIGITYHSKVDMRVNGSESLSGMSGSMAGLFGGSDYSTSAYTDLVLPTNVQFGYAFKPSDKWMFETDAAWYHWSAGRDINVRFAESDPVRLAVLNTGNPTVINPRDAWSFSAGTNYKMNEQWQLRGGFWYEPSIVPESTFSPAFMDLGRYGISTGLGYAITENLTVDAAYSAVFFHSRTVNNDVGTTTTGIPTYNVNGSYSDFANLLALNLVYKFGNKK